MPPKLPAKPSGRQTDPDEVLLAGARRIGLLLGAREALAFRTYREEILRWAGRMNLTALTNPADVVRQGFLDSLACAPLFPPETRRVIDIGSGAGFPAIPLAITMPGIQFALVESSRKKVTFLRHIARLLELSGIDIRPERAEDLLRGTDMLGTFDLALARAVAPLSELGPTVLRFLRPGGTFLAQVGLGVGVEEAVNRLERIGFDLANTARVPREVGAPGRRILSLRRRSVS